MWSARGLLALIAVSLALALPMVASSGDPGPPEVLTVEVTEHAPVIGKRFDRAHEHALEKVFQKALLGSLRQLSPTFKTETASLQRAVLSRARDFVFSYRILSQEETEDFVTLTVSLQIYREKLREMTEEAAFLSPAVPLRLLVLFDTFPMAAAGGEDIDAGRLAASALETELARRGLIVVAAPPRLPWDHLEGRVSEANRISLSTASGREREAEFVIFGRIRTPGGRSLRLTVDLLSVASAASLATFSSLAEQEGEGVPGDAFSPAAYELAGKIYRRLERYSPEGAPPASTGGE